MNKTNLPESKPQGVTDAEIQTALTLMDALKDELEAHTNSRMHRIPNNEGWNEKATGLDYELRGSLSHIHLV